MRHEFQGIGASRGTALGRARVRLPHALDVEETHIDPSQVEAEITRLHEAIAFVKKEMDDLRARLTGALIKEMGEFLDLHALMLDDPELLASLDRLIRTKHIMADYALRLQRDKVTQVFAAMDDPYLRARVDDIDQVIGRIHAALHRDTHHIEGKAGEILVAENIAPAEIPHLLAQGVIAVVTSQGSALSHSAILARSSHMPLVVSTPGILPKINDGDALIIDGASGLVILEPNAADLKQHRSREAAYAREQKQLHRLRRVPTRTLDDVEIGLSANAESAEDVAESHAQGATGIGLYRTEFLFLQRNELPTEEEQFRAYRDVVLGMAGRPVTVRTLDLGADKADRTGLALRNEPNPALGLRGIRLSMSRKGILETQLRALLRASGYGPLRILTPMISSREEVMFMRRQLRRVHRALRAEGHAVADTVPLGAMIEVPSAAIALSTFVRDVDFMAIGTNDLVQYLLAVDRNNDALASMLTPLHPAVLRLLHHCIALAERNKRPLSVCGEMAGDTQFTRLLLALGLREFSLHPSTLLSVRKRIRETDLGALMQTAPALLRARSMRSIERWVERTG